MKKLNKLNINPYKRLENEELIILRGGYGDCHCYRDCYMEEISWFYADDWWDCYDACWEWFHTGESVFNPL